MEETIMPYDFMPTAKKELHVFYVLDTSGSMSGAPIAALNDAMRDTVAELADISQSSNDAGLKIAVMSFDSQIAWVTRGTNGLEDAEDFEWVDLSAAGLTSLGAALTELNKKLSRNEMMASTMGNKIPVIIFMSDGCPTDTWAPALEELQKNKWFSAATKIAFALGDGADCSVLAKVVGGPEAVIKTNDLETFKKMIRIVSVTSSLARSQSSTSNEGMSGGDIVSGLGGNQTVSGDSVTITDLPDDPYTSIYGDNGAGGVGFSDPDFAQDSDWL